MTNATRSSFKKPASKPVKQPQLDALHDLSAVVHLIVSAHGSFIRRAREGEDPNQTLLDLLDACGNGMRLMVGAIEKLRDVSDVTHAGGRPKNKYRNLAFDVLTGHYIASGKVLKSKALISEVESRIPPDVFAQRPDDGTELFSQAVAREVIRDLKACLHSTVNDWN